MRYKRSNPSLVPLSVVLVYWLNLRMFCDPTAPQITRLQRMSRPIWGRLRKSVTILAETIFHFKS